MLFLHFKTEARGRVERGSRALMRRPAKGTLGPLDNALFTIIHVIHIANYNRYRLAACYPNISSLPPLITHKPVATLLNIFQHAALQSTTRRIMMMI